MKRFRPLLLLLGIILGGWSTMQTSEGSILYFSTITNDNPIAYWRFNETNDVPSAGAATNALDHTTHGNTGLYRTFATPSQITPSSGFGYNGPIGDDPQTAAHLSGDTIANANRDAAATSQNIKLPANLPMSASIGNVMTFEIWFYNERPVSENPVTGWIWSRGSDPNKFDVFGIAGNLDTNHIGQLLFYNGNLSLPDVPTVAYGTTVVTSNTWHHVALVRSNTFVSLYLDGALEFATNNVIISYTALNPDQMFLGLRPDGNYSPFKGSLAEAAVYGYALDASQIANHYSVGIATAEVPEPSTSMLVALAGFTLAAMRQLRSKRH